ncbi:MAG: hypothetical protein QW757_01800 [Candidatus Woesearchaeota archaeon]
MKKAQLAVETLMIYGIAILIVMVAIGALIGFGVLDLGGLLPDTCSITGASLTCDEYYFSKSTGLNMEITNNLGKNLESLNLTSLKPSDKNDQGLVQCDLSTQQVSFTVDGTNPVSATNPLINGEKASLSAINCLPAQSLKAGKKISLNFELSYKTVGSNLQNRKVSGKMRVTIVE